MTEQDRQDLSEVESLLGSRQQIAEWLEKLESAGTRTPRTVRDRVRTDYQERLGQIVEQLRSHSDVISSTLAGLRSREDEYQGMRSEEQERLAEAELRFTVGEFGQEEWSKVEADASGKLQGLDEELQRLAGEIARLGDVLDQISPAEAEPPVVEPMPVAPEPKPVVVPKPVVAVEPQPTAQRPPAPVETPEAPRFTARGGRSRESGPVRTIPFPVGREPMPGREPAPNPVDELTFLKSMTLDPRAASGTAPVSTTVENKAERPSQAVPKTLKCGECGSLNRPTEWYCERCGAELAAV